MLELFFGADIDDLLFEEFFELLFVGDVNEFIEFLFVNRKACLFVGPLT